MAEGSWQLGKMLYGLVRSVSLLSGFDACAGVASPSRLFTNNLWRSMSRVRRAFNLANSVKRSPRFVGPFRRPRRSDWIAVISSAIARSTSAMRWE